MVLSEKKFIAGEISRLIYFGTPLTKSEIIKMYDLKDDDYQEIMRIANSS